MSRAKTRDIIGADHHWRLSRRTLLSSVVYMILFIAVYRQTCIRIPGTIKAGPAESHLQVVKTRTD